MAFSSTFTLLVPAALVVPAKAFKLLVVLAGALLVPTGPPAPSSPSLSLSLSFAAAFLDLETLMTCLSPSFSLSVVAEEDGAVVDVFIPPIRLGADRGRPVPRVVVADGVVRPPRRASGNGGGGIDLSEPVDLI